MSILAAMVLAVAADEAQAGAAYKEAIEAVRVGRYEEAVSRLQEAIRHEPRETDRLQYRDREGRHTEAYYPHYVWSQARALQARGETGLARRRELLREAITHLDLTRHPKAAAMLDTVKAELAEIEKTAATPTTADESIVALRRRIEGLCDQEKFVEAARAAAAEKALLDRFPAEGPHLRQTIENHRNAVVARYARSLDLALETVAAAPALDQPEAIPRLLEPWLLPPSVSESPERRFVWLKEFLATVKAQLPATTLVSAKAFEASASKGQEAGLPSGTRAASAIAQAVRLRALAACRDDARLEALLADCEEAFRRSDAKTRPDSYGARLKEIRERLRERTALRDDLARWVRRAEGAFADRATMADPQALLAIVRELSPLEECAAWTEAAAGLRARGLFARALLEVVAALLEGEPPPQVSAGVKAARALDPDVDLPWKSRLSPKLQRWLDQIDR